MKPWKLKLSGHFRKSSHFLLDMVMDFGCMLRGLIQNGGLFHNNYGGLSFYRSALKSGMFACTGF